MFNTGEVDGFVAGFEGQLRTKLLWVNEVRQTTNQSVSFATLTGRKMSEEWETLRYALMVDAKSGVWG